MATPFASRLWYNTRMKRLSVSLVTNPLVRLSTKNTILSDKGIRQSTLKYSLKPVTHVTFFSVVPSGVRRNFGEKFSSQGREKNIKHVGHFFVSS